MGFPPFLVRRRHLPGISEIRFRASSIAILLHSSCKASFTSSSESSIHNIYSFPCSISVITGVPHSHPRRPANPIYSFILFALQ
ncbi:uncharacterized protein K444DRAFT_190297 [Hyaloscypha bicolor E]|uniref:Uncharacterized protein n=1 Tax=Hyaloscypha bicolor E TaxID=1095630 RepID=A0A2J6SPM1_9HELO|nr:uncharacterized protein K444DRAFT_190297 [Hyaloscypha bicolor E]PMD52732.1 hypothetical protein K444DRAFT_190297 [Hyaloscypha bicolor E]